MSLSGSYWPVGAEILRLAPSVVFGVRFMNSLTRQRLATDEIGRQAQLHVTKSRAGDGTRLFEDISGDVAPHIGRHDEHARLVAGDSKRAAPACNAGVEFRFDILDGHGGIGEHFARRRLSPPIAKSSALPVLASTNAARVPDSNSSLAHHAQHRTPAIRAVFFMAASQPRREGFRLMDQGPISRRDPRRLLIFKRSPLRSIWHWP